jgi:hypothetical protein
MKPSIFASAAALAALLPSLASASCGAAFCTVNTNWTSQSALVEAGSTFDLRYEYINQDQPFAGSDKIAVGQIKHHHDEVSTMNRNVVATYSRSFGENWGVAVTVPLADRDHLHVHNHHGEKINQQWNFTRLGDVRVVGRYQFATGADPLAPASAGVTFGLKLPTGSTTVANGAGDVGERSMQPGTGTTDLVLGGFYHKKLMSRDASWFAQAQFQQALNTHDNYQPGSQFSADVGYRHGLGERLSGLVQLNFVHKRADKGSEAEPADSGARFVFLSPGVSYGLNSNLQLYAFFQQPLYRHVNGVQLTADRSLLAGVSGRF